MANNKVEHEQQSYLHCTSHRITVQWIFHKTTSHVLLFVISYKRALHKSIMAYVAAKKSTTTTVYIVCHLQKYEQKIAFNAVIQWYFASRLGIGKKLTFICLFDFDASFGFIRSSTYNGNRYSVVQTKHLPSTQTHTQIEIYWNWQYPLLFQHDKLVMNWLLCCVDLLVLIGLNVCVLLVTRGNITALNTNLVVRKQDWIPF